MPIQGVGHCCRRSLRVDWTTPVNTIGERDGPAGLHLPMSVHLPCEICTHAARRHKASRPESSDVGSGPFLNAALRGLFENSLLAAKARIWLGDGFLLDNQEALLASQPPNWCSQRSLSSSWPVSR